MASNANSLNLQLAFSNERMTQYTANKLLRLRTILVKIQVNNEEYEVCLLDVQGSEWFLVGHRTERVGEIRQNQWARVSTAPGC